MAQGVQAGRLSIEIVAEIARLQTDLDKAKRAVAAASKDIANNARAANDNLRGIGAGAGAGIQQFSREVAALKSKLDPSFAALQAYKQQVGLLQKALAEGAISHKQFVEQMRGAVATYQRSGTAIAKSTGAIRSGMQQLSFQLNDVAVGFAAGTPPMVIFAQQSGQVIQALQLMTNSTKGFLGFLGGPWGMVITSALVVLAPFVAKLWESGDAANSSKKQLEDWSKSATLAAKATEIVQKMQERGILQNRYNSAAGPSSQSKAFFAQTELGKRLKEEIADLTNEIASNQRQMDMWSQRVDATTNRTKLLDRIASSTDKVAAATKRHEKAMEALDIARQAGSISDEEYVQQGIKLQKQLDAVKNSDKEAAKATREHAKAAREAAKAQKEYEKSLLGRVESGSLLGQMSTELDKLRGPFMKAVTGDWAREFENSVKQAADYQKDTSDYNARKQMEAGEKLLENARAFAEVIGGGFGRALNSLLSALDQFKGFFQNLAGSLDGLFKSASGTFANLFKFAGVGGAAAGATGGSGLGGMAGGALGGKLGESLLGSSLSSIAPMLGQFAGPIGAIAGGILGGVVGGLLKKTKKASATVEIMAGEAMQTSVTGNSAKFKKIAGAMADGLISGLSGIADQLGGMLGNGIKVSIGKRDKTFRVDLQGLGRTKNMPKFDTEEEAIAFAIQEVIRQGAITGLRAGTEALIKGQGDLQAQLQKAISFENVFKELADRANPAKASIDAITKEFDQLIDIFDEAGATAADYAQLQELMAIKQREVIEQAFEPIRTMLDDLKSKADDAGEAVKTAFQGVLDRETAAIEAYQAALEAQQQAARQKTIDALQESLSKLQDEAKGFADAADRLRQFSATVFGTPGIATLRANFAQVAAQAQGGDVAAMNKLPDVGAALRDAVTSNATDRVSMVRELNRIRIETDKAAGVADARVSAAERQAAAIEKQLTALTAIEETAISIDSLLAEMQTAKAAADLAREQMAKLGELTDTETSFADAVAAYEKAKAERDDLIRQITVAGFADLITVQQKTGDQLIAALQEVAITAQIARTQAADAIAKAQAAAAAAAATRAANDNLPWMNWLNGIPGFASGGTHGGGLRIVGEDGPELEYTGPSRIMNADQIASAVMGSASADEIGQAVAYHLRSDLYQIAKPLKKMDDRERRWDGDGMPPVRDVA